MQIFANDKQRFYSISFFNIFFIIICITYSTLSDITYYSFMEFYVIHLKNQGLKISS